MEFTGTWKSAYDGLVDKVMFFAEDMFAEQIGIIDDAVVLFRTETSEIEPVAQTIRVER